MLKNVGHEKRTGTKEQLNVPVLSFGVKAFPKDVKI
jgi:hypothetical protein